MLSFWLRALKPAVSALTGLLVVLAAGCGSGGGGGGSKSPSGGSSSSTSSTSSGSGDNNSNDGSSNGSGASSGSGNTNGGSTENGSGGNGGSTGSGGTAASTVDHITVSSPKSRLAVGESVVLTATAFSANGQTVPLSPQSFSWQSDNPAVLVPSDNAGTIFANPVLGSATITVTETASGKKSSVLLGVGFPLQITVDETGARAAVPIIADQRDDANTFFQIAPGGVFRWAIGTGAFSYVALRGDTVHLTAPATFGDRQFAGWTQNGQDAGTSHVLDVDPMKMSLMSVLARYVPRSADANGEYAPNALHDVNYQTNPPTATHLFRWDLTNTKIAFVTSDTFSPERKQNAVRGMNYWVEATGGEFHYTLLADDDINNADIIFAFTTHRALIPAPTSLGFSNDTPPPSGFAGTTYYSYDIELPDGSLRGTGKRAIYVFTDSNSSASYQASVAAHELFHAIGLNGHSSHPEDLMYGGGNGTSAFRMEYPGERDLNSFLSVVQQAGMSRAASHPANTARHSRRIY